MIVQRARNQNGFTLLELLIAIFLLTVGLLATAAMQETALNQNAHANVHTTSTMVAQQVMDDLMSVEVQPNSTVPNTQYWYTQFNQGTNNTALSYNRFPPINTLGSVPAGLTNLLINSVGTCTAKYTLTPNTPATFITRVQVDLYRPDQPNRDSAGFVIPLPAKPVITLIGYRWVPQ